MNFFRKELNLILFVNTIFILVVYLSLTNSSFAMMPPAPVIDNGEIEATVLGIYHPTKPQIDYGKIRIEKILKYFHHSRANYDALKVGDEIPVYFQWGTDKTMVNDINLPGVTIGDKISVRISGCPKDKGCSKNWTLYKYSLIQTTNQPSQPSKTLISGYVVGGGDTTPEGLFDSPRGNVYQVKQDDDTIIKVTYTAYPPSPVGDRESKKIRLSFHTGTIKVGDYLKARGSFDKTTQTLTVADEGDYIETALRQKEKEQPPTVILESSEISEKLLQQNYVDDVGSISLQPSRQTYRVQAIKKGKLFFFIPMSFNIQLEVDATTGIVKEIKKPWWSFLVR